MRYWLFFYFDFDRINKYVELTNLINKKFENFFLIKYENIKKNKNLMILIITI